MTLKEYAKSARKRLMTGYWQNVEKDKEKFLETYSQNGVNITQLTHMFQRKIHKEIYQNFKDDADEVLYEKVVKMLSENEYVLNPIMQLIDHNEFDKLDETGKQNYIFTLTDKYNELKSRYEKEKRTFVVGS